MEVTAAKVKAGDTATGSTAKFSVPKDATAVIHGHIEKGPKRSDGFVSDPKSNGGLGDASSLQKGLANGAVFKGEIGWTELHNGQITFDFPNGTMTESQIAKQEANLDTAQPLFHVP